MELIPLALNVNTAIQFFTIINNFSHLFSTETFNTRNSNFQLNGIVKIILNEQFQKVIQSFKLITLYYNCK